MSRGPINPEAPCVVALGKVRAALDAAYVAYRYCKASVGEVSTAAAVQSLEQARHVLESEVDRYGRLP